MLPDILRNPSVRQYLIVITANLNVFAIGLAIAWPSSMIVKLRNEEETVLDKPITEEEGSWIVSIGFLVGGILNFVPALTTDILGRKYSIIILNFPSVIGYLLLIFASELWHLILGRALVGASMLFLLTVIPAYASEISSTSIRGSLGTCLQVMCALGFVTMMSIGPYVSYLAVNIFCICFVITGLICTFFLPETPYFLYRKGRTFESLNTLIFLRGSEKVAMDELKEYEVDDIDQAVSKRELIKNPIFLKSLGLIMVIGIATQLIGFAVVKFYLETIIEMTQTSLSSKISSVIVGLIELVAAVITSAYTDRFGRKPIFIISLIGMAIGMVGLGVFFYVTQNMVSIVGFLNLMPIICVVIVIFTCSLGPGSLMYAIFSELLENKARGIGLSIAMVVTSLALFVSSKYFAAVVASIGPAATFWIFSGNCILLCLFIVFFVPETKGKSFSEIQIALGAKKVRHCPSS
ncbi:hypothetical protein ACJJTC_014143 [Scirpophaga incertulas]